MPASLRVALLGFGPAERTLIESVLRQLHPDGRNPEWAEDPGHADLILVNADDRWTARNLRLRSPVAPVLLVGDDDVGTGWPVMSRPLVPQALLSEAIRLLPAVSNVAGERPEFAATEPFAPLQASSRLAPARGFEETRPFERPTAAAEPPRPPARQRPAYDSIDARSVLLWRDEKSGVPGPVDEPPPTTEPVQPVDKPKRLASRAGMPAMAGFEPTRDAESQLPDWLPENWQELARQRDAERRHPVEPAEGESLSSSFADPSDHPTVPPGLAALGQMPSILLVGGSRLAGSSLIRELRGLGCQVDHAQDREAALARLAGQAYRFALLDDRSLKEQTRRVCRALRRRARALGSGLTIVVLARDDGALRRLLARWAGCDTWMTLPLDRERLARFLREGSGSRSGA
jgi:CheY-like chemotaxis protein